jgi:GPI mannosyltransferase 3
MVYLQTLLRSFTNKNKPWFGLTLLIVLGALLRLWYLYTVDTINFPDEIFQVYEQALRITKGYGIIPWEYQYGARSWILPGFIALILKTAFALGLHTPSGYLLFCKIILSGISLVLIPASYLISRIFFKNHLVALLTAFSIAVWYELVYFASRPLSEVLVTTLLFALFAWSLYAKRTWHYVLIGLGAGLSILLRYHYGFVLAGLTLVWWLTVGLKNKGYYVVWGILGFLVGLVLGGLIDHLTWGQWFGSIFVHTKLHIGNDFGSEFGSKPVWWYLLALVVASSGLWLFSLQVKPRFLLAPLVLILAIYSFVPHKEYRYAFFCIPYLLVMVTPSLVRFLKGIFGKRAIPAYLLVVSVFSVLGMGGQLWNQNDAYPQPPNQSSQKLAAYTYLSRQADICGVYDATSSWVLTGGYTYIAKDIPMYARDFPPLKEEFVNYIVTGAKSHEALVGYQRVFTNSSYSILKREGTCGENAQYGYERNLWDLDKKIRNILHS